jgi:hypothetical protein
MASIWVEAQNQPVDAVSAQDRDVRLREQEHVDTQFSNIST